MTEIERKALALIAEIKEERGMPAPDYLSARAALIRAIEQHEAFKQEVSDAVIAFMMDKPGLSGEGITRFIIAKPDPLVDILADAFWDIFAIPQKAAEAACEAIEKRGGKIVWGEGA